MNIERRLEKLEKATRGRFRRHPPVWFYDPNDPSSEPAPNDFDGFLVIEFSRGSSNEP